MNVRKFQLELAKAITRSSRLAYEDVYKIVNENSIQIIKAIDRVEKINEIKEIRKMMEANARNSTSSSSQKAKN
jgi:hypothetical protein